MKSLKYFLLIPLVFGWIACNRNGERTSTGIPSPTKAPTITGVPSPTKAPTIEIKPLFNAALLAGKTPKEVERILGRQPTDSWEPTDNLPTDNLSRWMQAYSIGSDMTVEYKGNSIDSFVIFFADAAVEKSTAYRLVGLDPSKPKPKGISDITTAQNWIKVFYSRPR